MHMTRQYEPNWIWTNRRDIYTSSTTVYIAYSMITNLGWEKQVLQWHTGPQAAEQSQHDGCGWSTRQNKFHS